MSLNKASQRNFLSYVSMSKPKVTRSMSKRAEGNGLAETKKTLSVDHFETVQMGVKHGRSKRFKSIDKENDKNNGRSSFYRGKVELRFVAASDDILDITNWLQTAKIHRRKVEVCCAPAADVILDKTDWVEGSSEGGSKAEVVSQLCSSFLVHDNQDTRIDITEEKARHDVMAESSSMENDSESQYVLPLDVNVCQLSKKSCDLVATVQTEVTEMGGEDLQRCNAAGDYCADVSIPAIGLQRGVISDVIEEDTCINCSQNDGKETYLLSSNRKCLSILEPIPPCPISMGPPKLGKCGTVDGNIIEQIRCEFEKDYDNNDLFDNHFCNRSIEASKDLSEMQPVFPISSCQSLERIPELVNVDSMNGSLADSFSEKVFQSEFQSPITGSPSSAVNQDDPLKDFTSCLGVNVFDEASVSSACHTPLSSIGIVSHDGTLKTNAQLEENRAEHTFSQDTQDADCDDILREIEISVDVFSSKTACMKSSLSRPKMSLDDSLKVELLLNDLPCEDEEVVNITGQKSTVKEMDNLVKEKTCIVESDQVPENSSSFVQHQNSMKNIVPTFRELHQIEYHENLVDSNKTYLAPMNDEVNYVHPQVEENKGGKRKVRFFRPNVSRMDSSQPLDYVAHSENNDVPEPEVRCEDFSTSVNLTHTPILQGLESRNEGMQQERGEEQPLERPSYEPVGIYTGSVSNQKVFYVGKATDHDWQIKAKRFYMVHETLPALCFYVQVNCPVRYLKEFCCSIWSVRYSGSVISPVVWFRKDDANTSCQMVGDDENIAHFNDRSAFIVTDVSQNEIPPRHSGLLWTCGNCYKGNSYKDNMFNHLKKESHQILFPHNIPPSIWGHEKTARKGTQWGEPCMLSKANPRIYDENSSVKAISNSSKVAFPLHNFRQGSCEKKATNSTDPPRTSLSNSEEIAQNNRDESFSILDANLQSHSEEPVCRKSQRLAAKDKDYSEVNLSLSDIECDSDGSEFKFDEKSESSSEEETDGSPKLITSKKKTFLISKKTKKLTFPDSDEEDGFDASLEQVRKERQSDRRSLMINRINDDASEIEAYVPDELDEIWERNLFLKERQTSSSKYRHFKNRIDPNIRLEMARGKIITDSAKSKFQSQAVPESRSHMRRLMSMIQATTNSQDDKKLPNGKIKYRYFVDFREDTWIYPFNILPLLETVESPHTKAKMYSVYLVFLDQIAKEAESREGQIKFSVPRGEEEKLWSKAVQEEKGRERSKAFVQDIDSLKARMARENPTQTWTAEKTEISKMLKEGRELFEQSITPDPKIVVPTYLNSEYVITLEEQLVRMADDPSYIPQWSELRQFTDDLLLRMCLKSGNRTQCFSILQRHHFARALKQPRVHWPLKGCEKGDKEVYLQDVLENEKNKNVSNAQDDVLKGYCITEDFHKTGERQPIMLWLSSEDMKLLQAYEEVSHRYALDQGVELDKDSPLFISKRCLPYITEKYNLTNFSKFLEITGLPRFAFYDARDWFVNHGWSQEDANMIECSATGAGHTTKTAKRYYLTDATKKLMSAKAHISYRSDLSLPEETLSTRDSDLYISETQNERITSMNEESRNDKLKEYLDVSSKSYNHLKATLNRVITEKAKCAMMRMIKLSNEQGLNFSNHGSAAELMLSEGSKLNALTQVRLLRMLDILPQDWDCIISLKENLLDYCELLRNDSDCLTDDIRKIEDLYTKKLARVLNDLRENKPIVNPSILQDFHAIALSTDSLEFTLGNESLQSQLKCISSNGTQEVQKPNISADAFADVLKKRKKGQILSSEECQSAKRSIVEQEDGSGDFEDVAFDVNRVVMNLPESPLKKRVKIGNIVIDSKDQIEVSEVRTVTKKVKKDKKQNVNFNDRMRRSLLYLYCIKANNPLVCGKGNMIRQCEPIYNNESIDMNGDLIELKQLANSPYTLGEIMFRRGKGGDTRGLSYPIFQVTLLFHLIRMSKCMYFL